VSGAGKFFVDFAFIAMGRKPTAASRPVIVTSYLLAMAFLGVGFLASGCSGWLFKRDTTLERMVTVVDALAFVYPHALSDVIGFACLAFVIASQKVLRKTETSLSVTTWYSSAKVFTHYA
jgi:TRAP-type uncharacterized transport system fused permease subunit